MSETIGKMRNDRGYDFVGDIDFRVEEIVFSGRIDLIKESVNN